MTNPDHTVIRLCSEPMMPTVGRQFFYRRIVHLLPPASYHVEFSYKYVGPVRDTYHWTVTVVEPVSPKQIALVRIALSEYLE